MAFSASKSQKFSPHGPTMVGRAGPQKRQSAGHQPTPDRSFSQQNLYLASELFRIRDRNLARTTRSCTQRQVVSITCKQRGEVLTPHALMYYCTILASLLVRGCPLMATRGTASARRPPRSSAHWHAIHCTIYSLCELCVSMVHSDNPSVRKK